MTEKQWTKTPPLFSERTSFFTIFYYPLEFKDKKSLQFEIKKNFETKEGKQYQTFKFVPWDIIPLFGALVKAYETIKKYEKHPDNYSEARSQEVSDEDDIPF